MLDPYDKLYLDELKDLIKENNKKQDETNRKLKMIIDLLTRIYQK